MMRIALLFRWIMSFVYFLRPEIFPSKHDIENTLGISSVNQMANSAVVRQALVIYCINKQHLPSTLNELYQNELSKDQYVDLDTLFSFSDLGNSEFELKLR